MLSILVFFNPHDRKLISRRIGDSWEEQVSLNDNDGNVLKKIWVPVTAAQYREATRDFCVTRNHETGRLPHIFDMKISRN